MRSSQLQTPQRDHPSTSCRSKSTPDLSKKQQKVTKKSLNPAFTAVSEEEVLESPMESTVFISPISAVSVDNPFHESAENFISPVNLVGMSSSAAVTLSDPTPSFSSSSSPSIITSDKPASISGSANKCENPVVNSFKKVESTEAEMLIKHLKDARIQVLNSKDMDHSKKLLDALLNTIIEEFYGGLYKENDWLNKLLTINANAVFMSLMLGILAVFVFLFLNLGAEGLPDRPTLT